MPYQYTVSQVKKKPKHRGNATKTEHYINTVNAHPDKNTYIHLHKYMYTDLFAQTD